MKIEFEDFCKSKGVKIACTYGVKWDIPSDFGDMDPWTVRLSYKGRRMQVPYFMGKGFNGREPEAADVVSSLLIEASTGRLPFEEFCSELGYDPDSRKALKCWKESKRNVPRLEKLLGDEYEDFEEAARDY